MDITQIQQRDHLIQIIKNFNLDCVIIFIDNYKPNLKDLLIWSSCYGRLDIVKFLESEHFEVSDYSKAIQLASINNHLDIVEWLNKQIITPINMSIIKQDDHTKFPFLYEIINSNHSYLNNLDVNEDFDSYIVLMNLYLYTCKFMKTHNIEFSKENIYNNMEKFFNNDTIRHKIISLFTSQQAYLKLQ